eukprot:1926453-Pyramimonas_sp.AAC.1
MNPKKAYWNNNCNRELHDRFKHLVLSGDEKGTIRKCWDAWNDKRCTAEISTQQNPTQKNAIRWPLPTNVIINVQRGCTFMLPVARVCNMLPHETTEKAVSTFCLGD